MAKKDDECILLFCLIILDDPSVRFECLNECETVKATTDTVENPTCRLCEGETGNGLE